MHNEQTTLEKAERFMAHLAAGVPFQNLAWGKSTREIKDMYLLAVQALQEKIKGVTSHENQSCGQCICKK